MRKKNIILYAVLLLNLIFFGFVASGMLKPILSHLSMSTFSEGTYFDDTLMSDPMMTQFLNYGKWVLLISVVLCFIDAVIVFIKEEHNIFLFIFAIVFYPVYLLYRNHVTDDSPWPFRILLIGFLAVLLAGGYDTYELSKKEPVPYTEEAAAPYILQLKERSFPFEDSHSIYDVLNKMLENPAFTVYDGGIRGDYLEYTGYDSSRNGEQYQIRFSLKDLSVTEMYRNGVKFSTSERDVVLKDLVSQIRW
ncbi:MAG: hypothetical protein PUB10_05930 [Clostridiales bacterium]|nr:hypothetical protein [Clostridiales bacterium]